MIFTLILTLIYTYHMINQDMLYQRKRRKKNFLISKTQLITLVLHSTKIDLFIITSMNHQIGNLNKKIIFWIQNNQKQNYKTLIMIMKLSNQLTSKNIPKIIQISLGHLKSKLKSLRKIFKKALIKLNILKLEESLIHIWATDKKAGF